MRVTKSYVASGVCRKTAACKLSVLELESAQRGKGGTHLHVATFDQFPQRRRTAEHVVVHAQLAVHVLICVADGRVGFGLEAHTVRVGTVGDGLGRRARHRLTTNVRIHEM